MTASLIEPTYSLSDEQHGWLLGGGYQLCDDLRIPIVAWALYPVRGGKPGYIYLVMFQLTEEGGMPSLAVWESDRKMVDGRMRAYKLVRR